MKYPRKSSNDKHKDHKGKYFKKCYYVKEDNGIPDDKESNYLDDGSDECVFMVLNVGTNSTNPKRCVKEIASETSHNIKGTMLTSFHAREQRNYWRSFSLHTLVPWDLVEKKAQG